MILPKTRIFVAYGHKPYLLDVTIKTVEKAELEGFRVKIEKVDGDQLAEAKTSSIYETLCNILSRSDAAIVLATADDMGAKRKLIEAKKHNPEDVLNSLEPRARENVVLELGMLLNKLGDKNILILVDRECKPPSDLLGRFWNFIDKESDAIILIRQFIEQTSRKWSSDPLTNQSQCLDYSDLKLLGDLPLKAFSDEFEKLETPNEKAMYLSERLVFDSYIQNPKWWRDRLDEIRGGDSNSLHSTVNILDCILKYMSAWRPPEERDFPAIEVASKSLSNHLSKIEKDNIALNPVVLIGGYDYLGLALNKLSQAPWLKDKARNYLEKSIKSFDECIQLAKKYDDGRYMLWCGYAIFNRARSLNDLMNCDVQNQKNLKEKWKEEMMHAIDIRKNWVDKSQSFPNIIQDGLTTEYFHAVAERIIRANKDGKKHINEDGPFSITDDWVKKKKAEFNDWWDNPRGLRVRLSTNVKSNWVKISELLDL